MREDDGELGLALEGPLAREGLEEDTAEPVDVRAAVDDPALDLLGRDVVNGADEAAIAGQAADRGDVAREAEVADVRALAAGPVGDEDVSGLHVAVDEPGRVCRVERIAHLPDDPDGAFRVEHSLPAQELAQVDAVHVGHREVQHVAVLAGGDRLDDVRVVERRRELRLAQEPTPEALVVGELGREELERDALPVFVLREVHASHRPTREQLADPEPADDAAGRTIDAHRLWQPLQSPAGISTSGPSRSAYCPRI